MCELSLSSARVASVSRYVRSRLRARGGATLPSTHGRDATLGTAVGTGPGRAFDRPPDDDNVIAVFTQTESLTAVGTVPLLILFARDRSRCHSECEMQKERASGVSTAEHASGGVRYRSASLRRVARHSATATGACLLPPVAALLQDRSHSESDSLLTAPSSSCRPTRARRQTGTAESR